MCFVAITKTRKYLQNVFFLALLTPSHTRQTLVFLLTFATFIWLSFPVTLEQSSQISLAGPCTLATDIWSCFVWQRAPENVPRKSLGATETTGQMAMRLLTAGFPR
jgi:hypothetical protein